MCENNEISEFLKLHALFPAELHCFHSPLLTMVGFEPTTSGLTDQTFEVTDLPASHMLYILYNNF